MTLKEMLAAGSLGNYMESRIHANFTEQADYMYGDGYLTREERIGISSAIGRALEAFVASVTTEVPAIYERARWEAIVKAYHPDPEDDQPDAKGEMPDAKGGSSWLTRLKESLLGTPAPYVEGFTLVKTKEGPPRFIAVVSNHFKDRVGEIITNDAHKEAIRWVEETGHYPELWLWHTKELRIGKVDTIDLVDGFVVQSGLLDEGYDPAPLMAIKDLGMSHGFLVLERAGDVITKYRPFESSVLPRSAACNTWTSYETLKKESEMQFSAEKRAFLLGQGIPEDTLASLEKGIGALNSTLKGIGLEWKDIDPEAAVDAAKAAEAVGATAIEALMARLDAQSKSLDDKVKAFDALVDQKVAETLGTARTAPNGVYDPKAAESNLTQKDALTPSEVPAPAPEPMTASKDTANVMASLWGVGDKTKVEA